jgi:hypothetical protein
VADIQACAAVRDLIGSEVVARLAGAEFARFDCWSCGRPGRTAQPSSVVVLMYRDGTVRVVLAHAGCAVSQVVKAAGNLTAVSGSAEDAMAKAAVLRFEADPQFRPLLLVELRSEAVEVRPDGEARSLWPARLLRLGLKLVGAGGELPAPVRRWRAELRGGGVRVTGPRRTVLFDGGLDLPGPWLDLASEWGGCVLLSGPLGLYAVQGQETTPGTLRVMLDRAALVGTLVGGVIPVVGL